MFILSSNIAANASNVDIMVTNDVGQIPERYLAGPSRVTYALEADAVGTTYRIVVGGVTYVDTSPGDAGGTLGVAPNLDAKAMTFDTREGGALQILVSEIAGTATTDIMVSLDIQ